MDEIARHVWQTKYRYKEGGHLWDRTIEDTWRRVACAVAAVEPRDREWCQDKFLEILKGYKFLPCGRILAGADTGRRVTLFNAISKTVNVPEASLFEAFRQIYEFAYDKGLKGCTAYRPNPLRSAVLQGGEAAADAPHWCALERETD